MILDLDSIPFFLDADKADNDYSLFSGEYSAGSSGLMRFENGELVLEIVTAMNEYSLTNFRTSRGDVTTRTIPLSMIQSIETKRWKPKSNTGDWKHFWNPKLIITTRSLKALEFIPTAQGNTLILTLETRGLANARAFAAQVTALLAEHRLRQIESGSGQKHLPPSQ
ncbi:MAG: hypothetical protein MUF71_18580 [Candidatus Kapabacteria bacterium]|jgi:hypothetical protein|nr:hypothetical protein [Candidatus Kapabacteria bacterium]